MLSSAPVSHICLQIIVQAAKYLHNRIVFTSGLSGSEDSEGRLTDFIFPTCSCLPSITLARTSGYVVASTSALNISL